MTLAEFTTSKGVWNGWHWRYVSLTVLALAVLQVVAFYAFHYPLLSSLPIAVLSVAYIVILRVRERRLNNALLAVVATFVIGLVLQLALEAKGQAFHGKQAAGFWETNGLTLVMGLVMGYAYLRLTEWSERKRGEMEAKRAKSAGSMSSTSPVRRHSGKKKKKNRRR